MLAQNQPEYNRSTKTWTTNDVNFPAGAEGRRDATLYAILIEDDALYQELATLITAHKTNPDYPQIESRIIKAANLVLDGHVREAWPYSQHGACANEIARVESTTQAYPRSDPYIIGRNMDGKHVSCNCTDWRRGFELAEFGTTSTHPPAPRLRTGQIICKHVLAWYFSTQLADPLAKKYRDNQLALRWGDLGKLSIATEIREAALNGQPVSLIETLL